MPVLLSQGINYKLPGPKGSGSVGTLSFFGMQTNRRQVVLPKGTWTVTERKRRRAEIKR